MYQLKNSRSVLDRYRSIRHGDSRKKMIGFRVSSEVDQQLRQIAECEGMDTSTLLRCLVREFVLNYELTEFDEGLRETIAVESLKDIRTWYTDDDVIADQTDRLRKTLDTLTKV